MIRNFTKAKIFIIAGLLALFVGCNHDPEKNFRRAYDIVYDSNGGIGKMASDYVLEGEKAKLKENEFTKLGYTFAGWLEAPIQEYDDNGEEKYILRLPGEEISLDTHVTFYAQWKENITRKISRENKKTIPVYYDLENKFTDLTVYFQSVIDEDGNEKVITDIPFVSMEDVPELSESNIAYGEKPEMVKNGSVYTLSRKGELVNFYFDTDQIGMTDIDNFTNSTQVMKGLDLLSPSFEVSGKNIYIERVEDETYYVSAEPKIINLADYDIYLLTDSEGNGYVPLQTLEDLTWTHCTGLNNGNAIYLVSDFSEDFFIEDYYSKVASEPSWELVEFSFNETCLVMDNFYGLKDEHGIKDFRSYISLLSMKDGTQMLSSFLYDGDPLKPSQALSNLIFSHIDDLHSSYIRPSPYISADSLEERSELVLENTIIGHSLTSYWDATTDKINTWNKYFKTMSGDSTNSSMYEDYEYDDGIVIILTFDSFENPVYDDHYDVTEEERIQRIEELIEDKTASIMELVVYTQYKIRKYIEAGKKVKAVVIDDSINTGGSVDAGIYINAWIKHGEESFVTTNTFTNAQSVCRYKIDTNFDGVFDEDDSLLGLSPETKIYCLTSGVSFSCGNYMPSSIKGSENVTIIGQRTSGGTCCLKVLSTALGDFYTTSSPYRLDRIVNGSKYSIDTGIDPDVYISNYENLYDRTKLVELINNLK